MPSSHSRATTTGLEEVVALHLVEAEELLRTQQGQLDVDRLCWRATWVDPQRRKVVQTPSDWH